MLLLLQIFLSKRLIFSQCSFSPLLHMKSQHSFDSFCLSLCSPFRLKSIIISTYSRTPMSLGATFFPITQSLEKVSNIQSSGKRKTRNSSNNNKIQITSLRSFCFGAPDGEPKNFISMQINVEDPTKRMVKVQFFKRQNEEKGKKPLQLSQRSICEQRSVNEVCRTVRNFILQMKALKPKVQKFALGSRQRIIGPPNG